MSAAVECPLCLEKMDIDDLAFFPCSCKYQICRFCWNRIRTEENGLCPACREVYTDQPSTDFNSISNGSTDFRTTKKKRKDLTKNKNIGDMMKVLPELRVVQPNLIFVIGLPPWMSKERDQLAKEQYFGKFGKVFKVEINQNQTFTGPQGSSSISAYVTYNRAEDAMHAITELDQTYLHSRQLRVSLGTTKYCSQFLKGSKCTKHECMYLHELGDPEASFTKEQMQNGKHTDYMNKLLRDYSQNNTTVGKSGFGFADSEMMHEHEENEHEECTLQSDSDNVSPQIIQTNPQSNGLQTPATKAGQPVKANQLPVPNPATPNNATTTTSAAGAISGVNNQNSKNRQKTPISLRKQQTGNCSNKGKEKCAGENMLNDSLGIHLDDNTEGEMRNSSNQFIFGHHQPTFNDEDSNVDIDFDPFSISQNGLAELLAAEQDRISRLNLGNNTNNNNLDNSNHWAPSSMANVTSNANSNNQGVNTSVQNSSMRNFQQPPIGVCIQRLGHGESAGAESTSVSTSARVIHPPPGFEEKPIQTVACSSQQTKQQSTTTSHPPGLAQIPDHDLKVSQNYAVNSMSTPSKVGSLLSSSQYDHSSNRELCQNTLVKALDLACIAFRIALTLDNQDDEKFGIDLNTFLLHLSDSTGIDYIRLQSAIAKSSKVSCILSSTHSSSSTSSNNANNNNNNGTNNNNNNSATNGINGKLDSKFNGIFQQLSRPGNEDILRHNSLWSGATTTTTTRDRAMMESVNNCHSMNSSNPMASTNGGIVTGSLFTSQGSPNIQNFDLHSKHSQSSNNNSNNTWHIDDPAIVSGRFTLQDSSETNIRSCLWQPTTSQPSFMNPQSSNIVRQMNFNNMSNANQSLTWSHSHLHQSQPNQTSDNSETNVPDKKHQTIFHSYTNNNNTMESSNQKLSGGSRHLQNVIKNFSVS